MELFNNKGRRIVLTAVEEKLLQYILEQPRTTEEMMAYMEYTNRKSLSQRLCLLRDKGIPIKKQKYTKDGKSKFWIDEPDLIERINLTRPSESPLIVSSPKEKLYRSVASVQKSIRDIEPAVSKYRTFEFDEPIAIPFMADLHLGHSHCDYDLIEKQFDMVRDNPGVFPVFPGDLIDNSVNALAPKGTTDIVDKEGQLQLLDYLFDKIRDRILIIIPGNHEIRSWVSDHFHIDKYLSQQWGTPYIGYGVPFYVKMNRQTYKIFCRHQARGKSQYNPLHPCIRSIHWDFSEYAHDADIVVTAHWHEASIGHYMVAGRERILITCGTSLYYDEYAERIGFKSGLSDVPIVVLPLNSKPIVFKRFNDGLNYLKYLRHTSI